MIWNNKRKVQGGIVQTGHDNSYKAIISGVKSRKGHYFYQFVILQLGQPLYTGKNMDIGSCLTECEHFIKKHKEKVKYGHNTKMDDSGFNARK